MMTTDKTYRERLGAGYDLRAGADVLADRIAKTERERRAARLAELRKEREEATRRAA